MLRQKNLALSEDLWDIPLSQTYVYFKKSQSLGENES